MEKGIAPVARTRVLLADDHRLILEAVRVALEADGRFEVVAATCEPLRVLPLVAELRPEVVVLDVRMPRLDGIACLKRIRAGFPNVAVVMLSGSEDAATVEEALELGACAFVPKHLDPRDLGDVICQALAGRVYRPPGSFAEATATIAAAVGLTRREQAILSLLATGRSNAEIAKELCVAEQTIKFHLSNVYRKLDVNNRTAAVRSAQRRGLIGNPLLQETY